VKFAGKKSGAANAVAGAAVLTAAALVAVALYFGSGYVFPQASLTSTSMGPQTSSDSRTSAQTNTSGSPPGTTTTSGSTNASTLAGRPLEFIFSTSPDTVLLAPGLSENYVTLALIPLPSQSAAPDETISLSGSAPSGLSIAFATNTVRLGSGSRPHVAFTLAVGRATMPGNYTIGLQGKVGSLTENSTLTVRVVQNLVFMINNAFVPSNITIRPGSTVYWMSLDPPPGAYPGGHTVTFTTGTSAQSPTLQQYDWYSHQFTERGDYVYHCTFHAPGMKGVVAVSSG
jgi:plastocyanin